MVDGHSTGGVSDSHKHDQLDNLDSLIHPSLPSEDMDRMLSQELEHIDNHTLEAVFKGVLNNEHGSVTSPKIGEFVSECIQLQIQNMTYDNMIKVGS
jgi:hypothetical protein